MKDKKLRLLLITLEIIFYVVWTASIIALYILIFAKEQTKPINVFILGFSQASWIYSVINTIKDYLTSRKKEQEESNITITINKEVE